MPLVLLDNHILACPNFKFNKKDYSLEMGPILWRIESMYQGKSIPYITIKLRPIFYEYGVFEMTEIEIKTTKVNQILRGYYHANRKTNGDFGFR